VQSGKWKYVEHALDCPQFLNYPFSAEDLAAKLEAVDQDAFAHPVVYEHERVDVTGRIVGDISEAKFFKSWQCLYANYEDVLHYEDVVGYHIVYVKRDFKNKSYANLRGEFTVETRLPADATYLQVAKAVLDVYQKALAHFEPDFEKLGKSPLQLDTTATKDDEDSLEPFGYKSIWFALKDIDASKAVQLFNLTAVGEVSWKEGIAAVYDEDAVFISPPLDGYTLVVGLNKAFELDELKALAAHSSDLQYFLTHRVVDYHAWARFKKGKLLRAYSFCGEDGTVAFDEGEAVQDEKELGCTSLPTQDGNWPKELSFPTEDHVIDLAARWGIDPQFRKQTYQITKGLLCRQ
jgi:hypothetical protein